MSTLSSSSSSKPPSSARPVLAAVDGSSFSRKVAEVASRIADAFNLRLALLHVVEPLTEPMASRLQLSEQDWIESRLREGQLVLEELCRDLRLESADRILLAGPVPETICGEAEDADAEMIVLGAHGHGPVPRIMLGSVGDRVASLATRTVTIVR